MNKKVKYIFIGLGLALIILGLSLLLMTGEQTNNKENSNGIEIDISQDDMQGDKIDNQKYQLYEGYIENAETYINSSNMLQKNRYTFTYPTFLINTKLDDKHKSLYSDNISIEVFTVDHGNIEDCKKNLIESHDNDDTLLQTYDHKEKISISGFDAYYLKINYLEKIINEEGKKQNNYNEKFIILIQESANSIVVMTITTTDLKLSNKVISDFINNIKIEKEVAIYTYGVINDTVVQGSIKQKRRFSDETHSINYELSSNDYQEMPITENNIYRTKFESRNVNAYIDIEIHIDEDLNFMDNYIDGIKTKYSNNSETDFELKTVNYNDISYSKIDFEYYDSIDKVTNKKLYLIREVSKDIYYTVEFTSKDEASEDMINDFLNVKYEFQYPKQENQE